MPRRKKVSYGTILYEQQKQERLDQEAYDLYMTAEHEGIDPNQEPQVLAEKLGWGKTWEEAYEEFENKIKRGYVMKKIAKGDTYIKLVEITRTKRDDKKGKQKYNYGYIETTVPEEFIGGTAMVVLSKTKTPKILQLHG